MDDNTNIGATSEQTAEQTSQEQTAEPKPAESKSEGEQQPTPETKSPEKTYTQAEVNSIVEKRLKRERMSAEEKADKALKEISNLKTRNVCYKLGIKEDCIDDAVALAEKLVNDKTDITAALSEVIKKYPVFGEDRKHMTTGVHTKTTHETDDSALRKAFGLPPKK